MRGKHAAGCVTLGCRGVLGRRTAEHRDQPSVLLRPRRRASGLELRLGDAAPPELVELELQRMLGGGAEKTLSREKRQHEYMETV